MKADLYKIGDIIQLNKEVEKIMGFGGGKIISLGLNFFGHRGYMLNTDIYAVFFDEHIIGKSNSQRYNN